MGRDAVIASALSFVEPALPPYHGMNSGPHGEHTDELTLSLSSADPIELD